ncbi:MAG: AAA family ATPase [Verrucomicrobia bacterium]|nr:AAA family ATPase [Verrucomicrobiota bacterium]
MLETLSLKNLGPAPALDFEFGERLNLITGDNGLGKTFLLDVAWWALTRCWTEGRKIHPAAGVNDASVSFHVHGKGGPTSELTCHYRRDLLDWSAPPPGRPPSPGLVIYARIDGGFSLWDPERNGGDRPEAFRFNKKELWEGLRDEKDTVVCRGLLEDWETWSLKTNGAFNILQDVLAELSPGGHESPLVPGRSVRVPEMGVRDVPTLEMPYGTVPLPYASAGMKRILSLAYMLVWAWTEHQAAAELRGKKCTGRIVLLWDEVEAHLHPQWQRTILPAVLTVLNRMLQSAEPPQVQVIATTHAPFVLASVETLFDESRDRLFNLELTSEGRVRLETVQWARFGSIIEWLRSPAFDMKSGYSKEAEQALIAANRWIKGERDGLNVAAIQAELGRTLANSDPFWPRWLVATGGVR